MLNIRTIPTDRGDLIDYYENDESLVDAQERYYTEGEPVSETDAMTCAVWHGKGAALLSLSGHIEREDFIQLSRGTIPGTT